jgi:hypothetical protein
MLAATRPDKSLLSWVLLRAASDTSAALLYDSVAQIVLATEWFQGAWQCKVIS